MGYIEKKKMKKILIFDYLGTILARGIPIYVNNLEALLKEQFIVNSIRAPEWHKRLPRILQNIMAVFYEQVVMPWTFFVKRPDLVIFPYNSSSLICSLSCRSLMIVHDLIPYKKSTNKLSAAKLYIWLTFNFHRLLGRRIAAVSPYMFELFSRTKIFSSNKIFYIPNCFNNFEKYKNKKIGVSEENYILLVSGTGKNKNLEGALTLYSKAVIKIGNHVPKLKVVGFGQSKNKATEILNNLDSEFLDNIKFRVEILGLVSDEEMWSLYSGSQFVWAHSLQEGFGRVVVEGRLANRAVLISDLKVFKDFCDEQTYKYKNNDICSYLNSFVNIMEPNKNCNDYSLHKELELDAIRTINKLIQ